MEKSAAVIGRAEERLRYFTLLIKLYTVAMNRKLRMVIENPWSEQTYLKANFVAAPSLVDENRMLRGDYFIKPTAYWFINCEHTNGMTEQHDKERKKIARSKAGVKAGVCSEDRSMISPDYARNFICDFIIGKEQAGSQMSLF